jgi:hypothetical protein
MIHPVLRRPAHRISPSVTSGDGRRLTTTAALAVLFTLAACTDPTEPHQGRAFVGIRPNPVVIGVGGGFDEAGNSGSVPGTQWFPTGWAFVPRFGDFGNTLPMHCTTYGRCNAGNLALSIGTLGLSPNPDPNPGPESNGQPTVSRSFGYMTTSAFEDGGTIAVRASAIERAMSFAPSASLTGKGRYRLAFDYAFLTNTQAPDAGSDPFAIFQLLWDEDPLLVPRVYERVDQAFRISRSDLAGNAALQQAGGCGQGGIGDAVYSLCTGWRNTTVDIPAFYNGKQFVLRLLLQDGGAPYSELDAVDRLIPDNSYASVIAFDNFKVIGLPLLTGVGPVPDGPVAINTLATATATFDYADPAATHTGAFSWGDNGTSTATPTQSGGSGSFTGTHTYVAPGVYTVTATVTDNASNSSSGETAIAVYDPNSAFVTGAGWIMSPPNAYAPDLTMTGKAHFAFVSKILKGAQGIPTGTTNFRFQAADFVFESTSYEWLVVGGSTAQFKGSGTINDAGNYAFILTAVDGNVTGGGGIDRFRIKIWNKTTDQVVYDNQRGAADGATPSTALGGGSISIKK